MIRYGIATSILGKLPLREAMQRIAAAGIEQIEITTEPPHFTPGVYDAATVRGWLDEFGLHSPVGHALFCSPNMSSLDETTRLESVRQVTESLELLACVIP